MSTTVYGVGAEGKSGASAGVIESRRQISLLKRGALQDAIFNSVNFSSIATDAQGVIQIFNVGAERMLGYKTADVINKITPAEISDPQELIARAEALSAELGTPITPGFEALVFKASRGIEDIYELTYIRNDGSRFPAMVSVTALRDVQNNVIGYLLIGTDNTARKQVESAQRAMAEMQKGILNALPAHIALLDSNGVILTVNEAWRRFAAVNDLQSANFCVGQNYLNICESATGVCSDESGSVAQGIRDVLSGSKAIFSIEYPCHSPDEKRWFRLIVTPLTDHLGSGAVVMHVNVTDRRQAEEAILQLNSELEDQVQRRTQRLEAANKDLEAFSYSVSHDLRSPLNTINGFTQLLLKSDGDQLSEKGRHYLKRIRAASTGMGELMDGLLSLAKISTGTLNRRKVDLTAMSLNFVQELRDAEPDRVVDIGVQANLMINGDPAMVAVVMKNLIGNAWKYSGKTPHARVEIGSEAAEDGVTRVFVRDNGAGFDMAHAEKLFGVFQRLHADTEFTGTGIGLANVKRAVERHGGRVWAQASPGEGAIFRFTLQAVH